MTPRTRERSWLLRPRTLVLLGGAVVAVAAVRHLRDLGEGRHEPGGVLIADAAVYDRLTGLALGTFFARVAEHVATRAPTGARVLEVGCGPGHLSIRMAARGGLDVTGLDLDPAMIERARGNADRSLRESVRRPSFLVGDVSALAFPDASFDLIVSTLSMHHWADPGAGLDEIGRVLRPGGRALVWDLRPGIVPFHAHVPDPVEQAETSSMRVIDATPWRWPLGLPLTQRIELAPPIRA
ncbi:MAG TPA: class I SAM-dependent methyltransferase [Actinomycetota bacterium]|nr:class I SAM-dependent methyltransferase [Actinomycetota bacterium]